MNPDTATIFKKYPWLHRDASAISDFEVPIEYARPPPRTRTKVPKSSHKLKKNTRVDTGRRIMLSNLQGELSDIRQGVQEAKLQQKLLGTTIGRDVSLFPQQSKPSERKTNNNTVEEMAAARASRSKPEKNARKPKLTRSRTLRRWEKQISHRSRKYEANMAKKAEKLRKEKEALQKERQQLEVRSNDRQGLIL